MLYTLCEEDKKNLMDVMSNEIFEKEQYQEIEFVGVHFLVSFLRYPVDVLAPIPIQPSKTVLHTL